MRVDRLRAHRPWPASCRRNAGSRNAPNRSAPSRICAQLQPTWIFTIETFAFSRRREGRRLEFRHRLRRSHIGPDEAAPFARRIGLVLHLLGKAALRRLRRHLDARCRPRPSSSRDRGSAARIPRCGRRPARRGDAGNIRRARRAGRRCRGTPRGPRRAAGPSPASPSGSATSSIRQAGIQCRRMSWPIGASPSTRHSRSFSSCVSIGVPPSIEAGPFCPANYLSSLSFYPIIVPSRLSRRQSARLRTNCAPHRNLRPRPTVQRRPQQSGHEQRSRKPTSPSASPAPKRSPTASICSRCAGATAANCRPSPPARISTCACRTG